MSYSPPPIDTCQGAFDHQIVYQCRSMLQRTAWPKRDKLASGMRIWRVCTWPVYLQANRLAACNLMAYRVESAGIWHATLTQNEGGADGVELWKALDDCARRYQCREDGFAQGYREATETLKTLLLAIYPNVPGLTATTLIARPFLQLLSKELA